MEMMVLYVTGSIIGLILTIASFIAGVRTLQQMEEEQWLNELRQRIEAIG